MFTNRKPTALDELSKRMLEQGQNELKAKRLVNEALGINDKSQLPREHLGDWNRRYEETLKSLNEGVEPSPQNLQELSKNTLDSYVVKATNDAIDNVRKNPKKFEKRGKGTQLAAKKLALKEERPDDKLVPEETVKEEDEGKPGKNFAKIAAKAAKEYGSKKAGERVAGAIRAKMAKKGELEEENLQELSKDTLKSYIDKSKKSIRNLADKRSEVGSKLLDAKARGDKETAKDADNKWHKVNGKITKRWNGLDSAKKKLGEELDNNAGIAGTKVNKELKVGFTWVNGKGTISVKKAETNADIADPKETHNETGSKTINPAVQNLQEISSKAIGNYIKGAVDSISADSFVVGGQTALPNRGEASKKMTTAMDKKTFKRQAIVNKATQKLVSRTMKEDTGIEAILAEILMNKPELAESVEMMESAFGDAFKAARQAGKSEFSFGGKSFNTRQKGETDAQWKANMAKNNVAPTPQNRPVATTASQAEKPVAIQPQTNPASVAAKRTPGMEGPGQSTSGPSTPNATPVKRPEMTGRISPPSSVSIRPETNPASVAAKRTVGMEGPGQSVSGPKTPNAMDGAVQRALSKPVVPAADRGLAQPTPPANNTPPPANNPIASRNINQDVSNSINPSNNTSGAFNADALQGAVNQKAALQAATINKAKSMQEEKAIREVSLIESILSKPAIKMGESAFAPTEGDLHAL